MLLTVKFYIKLWRRKLHFPFRSIAAREQCRNSYMKVMLITHFYNRKLCHFIFLMCAVSRDTFQANIRSKKSSVTTYTLLCIYESTQKEKNKLHLTESGKTFSITRKKCMEKCLSFQHLKNEITKSFRAQFLQVWWNFFGGYSELKDIFRKLKAWAWRVCNS